MWNKGENYNNFNNTCFAVNKSGEEREIMVEMKEMKNNFNPPLLSTVLPAKRVSLYLLCYLRKIKGNKIG